MRRVEVLTGPERRRRWSAEQKRSIVEQAFAPGACLAEVARQADVRRGQIYRWRRELRTAAPGFAEVMIAPEPTQIPTTPVAAMEVDIGRDIRVRIPSATPIGLAAAVIKALAAR
jgi:transposase